MSVSITLTELKDRWLLARLSAIRSVSTLQSEEEFFFEINSLTEEKYDGLLKKIFLNSRKLGNGYQKNYNLVWERSDFVKHISSLGSSCLAGDWTVKTNADSLKRPGCQDGRKYGAKVCQYWREAIDGLVLGLSDDVGYVRYSSIATTKDENFCEDIFYQEEKHLTDAIWDNKNKWGPLPESITTELSEIEKKFQSYKINLKFLGLAEQQLYYKLEPQENLTCGTAGTLYRSRLEKIIGKKFPTIRLKDASPVAVYGEKT